jgi:hypothetical protein
VVQFIYQYSSVLRLAGADYVVRVYADQQPDGLWQGWFVFFPLSGGAPVVTDRETTQSTREAVVYWASGISPVYLEGALRRAHERLPTTRLLRHIAQAEQDEVIARAEAEVYRTAAAEAISLFRASRRRSGVRMLHYIVTEGRARVLDRLNLRDRATYGHDWMVLYARTARDALRQWRLFKAGTHPQQGELELEVTRYRLQEAGYTAVWEAETEAIASKAAQAVEDLDARRAELKEEQAVLDDRRDILARAARLDRRTPARRRTSKKQRPATGSAQSAKRRKRAG